MQAVGCTRRSVANDSTMRLHLHIIDCLKLTIDKSREHVTHNDWLLFCCKMPSAENVKLRQGPEPSVVAHSGAIGDVRHSADVQK